MRLPVIATLAAFLSLGSVAAMAADRNVDIVNQTGHTMIHFYASNTGTDSWEEDILGHDKLASGDTQPVDIDDGTGACKFDFKAVFSDGSSSVKRSINVCKVSTFTYE
jgi:hypothetical protein